jgi:DNA-binding CsgD family transcriptional regulator/tetratricopeptide (TPR) repeat protein
VVASRAVERASAQRQPGEGAVNDTGEVVVGRERESAQIEDFLRGASRGASSLVIQGVAGIGKTVMWTAALAEARARGLAVRECRCAQADTTLPFAGLGDLLDGLDEATMATLPSVQRRALSAALLLGDAGDVPATERVVGMAVLNVLRALATVPLVLAIDDVQWLDASSTKALTFALRRLRDEHIHLLASYRVSAQDSAGVGADLGLSGRRIPMGPLSVGALRRILRSALTLAVSRPTLIRLHDATGGNPMACLEIGRALQRLGREPLPDEPLPVPTDLRVLVAHRLHGLAPGTRELLLLCAALAHPTVAMVLSIGNRQQNDEALAEAVAAGVLECDGDRVRFVHPLLASVPYAGLTPDARRQVHVTLAAAVSDPEEHARHAALGSDVPDAAIAAALEQAARRASRRGSADAAAELAELAVGRTPLEDTVELQRRRFDAAEYLFHLGEPARARSMASAGVDLSAPGAPRVRGLLLLATIAYWTEGDSGPGQWIQQAMNESGSDPLLMARCHVAFADQVLADAAESLAEARAAVGLLETMAEPPAALLSTALKLIAYHELRVGRGLSQPVLERALALDSVALPVPVMDRAGMYMGMLLRFACQFDQSRRYLLLMRDSALDEGDDSSLPNIYGHVALLDCWTGNYRAAIDVAVVGRELIAHTGIGSPSVTSAHSLAEAHLGHLDVARSIATADLAADEALEERAGIACQLRSLGFIELSAGNLAAAATHLLRAIAVGEGLGVREPGILRVHGDAIEALIGLGRLDEAMDLVGELERSTGSGLPWSLAIAGRCRGHLLAARGDVDAAVGCMEKAVVDHERVPMPFERARTLLLLGTTLRRARRNRDARAVLESAREVFARLGTPVFTERAGIELASVGGRVSQPFDLTATETRVAGLTGAGRTNREVADALFMSVRTVESHLAHIYRKLGVRSRTELARRIAVPVRDP